MGAGKYSPTISAAYHADQDWWHKNGGGTVDVCYDSDGYDSYGYNKDNVDRAGHEEDDYDRDADLVFDIETEWSFNKETGKPCLRFERIRVTNEDMVALFGLKAMDRHMVVTIDPKIERLARGGLIITESMKGQGTCVQWTDAHVSVKITPEGETKVAEWLKGTFHVKTITHGKV
jgi:hypothetical protein